MLHEAFADKLTRGDWRVEAINHAGEGECHVTIFSGPNAQGRAEEYAKWKNSTLGSELVGKRTRQSAELYGNFDAGAWAQQFTENVKSGKIDPTDLDTVRAWFANAIMTGHDNGKPVNGDHAAHLIEKGGE